MRGPTVDTRAGTVDTPDREATRPISGNGRHAGRSRQHTRTGSRHANRRSHARPRKVDTHAQAVDTPHGQSTREITTRRDPSAGTVDTPAEADNTPTQAVDTPTGEATPDPGRSTRTHRRSTHHTDSRHARSRRDATHQRERSTRPPKQTTHPHRQSTRQPAKPRQTPEGRHARTGGRHTTRTVTRDHDATRPISGNGRHARRSRQHARTGSRLTHGAPTRPAGSRHALPGGQLAHLGGRHALPGSRLAHLSGRHAGELDHEPHRRAVDSPAWAANSRT